MGSLFEIAKSGIQAYRQALAVTGQNIANVNTEGYSKRDVSLSEMGGIQGGVTDVSDQSGLGVRVDGIRRSFNAYVNERLRNSLSSYEQSLKFTEELSMLENTLLPEGSDLGKYIGNFFSSLQGIASEPADSAPRTIALEAGKDLANSFVDYSDRLTATQNGAFSQAKISIENINLTVNQLANINAKLKSAGATTSANDLLDTRDLLLNDLAKELEFTTEYNDRGDIKLKLGSSGQGPVLVSGNEAYNLRAKVTSNTDFRYSVESTVNSLSMFIVDGVSETSTTQVTGGKLAGLVNFYAYVQEVSSDVDGLASRIASDFNNAQASGKDLDGKLGKSMFSIGIPDITTSTVVNSDLSINVDQIGAEIQFPKEINFKYSTDGYWVSDKDNSKNKGPIIAMTGFNIRINGNANVGDIFTLKPKSSIASSLQFNLSSGRGIAAASTKLVESSTNNTGTGELKLEGSYKQDSSHLLNINNIFSNNDTSLLATNFIKDTSIASIPAGMQGISLNSYSLQPLAKFSITDDEAKSMTAFDLSLANGSTVAITISSSDKGHKVVKVEDLAAMLNSGYSPGGNAFNFASLGLFASGRDGNLTISSASTNFSSAVVSTKISGSLNASVSNPTTAELKPSDVHIFTREGIHIAGSPLSITETAGLINKDNGFLDGAKYSAQYINGDYRGVNIKRNSVDGDYVLNKGASASRSTNPVTAQTLSVDLFQDGIVDKTFTIPVSSSTSYALKEFNKSALKLGISAEAITRVLIDPIDVTINGTVSMALSSGIKDSANISATVLPNDLTNLVTEINRVSDITGVTGILTSDKKRVILENKDADDIIISNFVSPSSTTATVLDNDFSSTSQSISLSSSSNSNSAIFTGSIKFLSSVDFEITSTDGSSKLSGDAAINGLDKGMFNITRSSTGEVVIIDPISHGLADLSRGNGQGTAATSALGAYSLTLPASGSGSSFTATINTGDLVENNPKEVAKALLENMRGSSPDVRIIGTVINQLPVDGSKLSVNFEGQTYVLNTSGNQIEVKGGEEGRVKGYFTPVNGWSGANATILTTDSSWTLSNSNTLQISVDGTSSGTITLPAATYSSNTGVAAALQTVINADSTLSTAGKSVLVKWTGLKYEIVSNTADQTYSIGNTTQASIKITAIDSGIDAKLKLSTSNSGSSEISGYQIGISAQGSISGSQIVFPDNSQNNTIKTSIGLDSGISKIEGAKVTNNPSNQEYFNIKIKTGSWMSGTASAVTSASNWVLSNSSNTFQIAVDDIASGAITLPAATYTDETGVALALQKAINADSALSGAGKSVEVLWDNTSYQIVSMTGTSDASIGITSVDSTIEGYLKFTAANGGVATDSSSYRAIYNDASWTGATATAVTSSSNWVLSNSGNTFQVTIDGQASGSLTLPAATYTSNTSVASALETAINGHSSISGVEVRWNGTGYKIISSGSSSQNVLVTAIDSTIEAKLKLSSSNGGVQTDYSFDLKDVSGSGENRIFSTLRDINIEWDSTNKNISISRKLATASLHEVSFETNATRNENFGIKVHPNIVALVDNKIKITSGTGTKVDLSVTANANKSRVGQSISMTNLPPEELIVVLMGGGSARSISANYDEEIIPVDTKGQNLNFVIDDTNNELVLIKDADTGHNIGERQLDGNGRFNISGLRFKLSGSASVKDSFSITDNIGGVGDGRNVLSMLDLQNDSFTSEGKGNYQGIFSEVIASVGSSVQSSKLNTQSAEMIKNASESAASELSGVNMDDEAAQLIEYQQAYQASARVLQTARELFNTLIDTL